MGKPIDVFVTTGARHSFRIFLAAATISAWCHEIAEGRASLVVYDVGADPELWEMLQRRRLRDRFQVYERPAEGSQRLRHEWAARESTSELYVVADDDIRPLRVHRSHASQPEEDWPAHAERVFAERPDLAMATTLCQPGNKDPESLPAAYRPQDPDLWDVGSAGGIRVVRSGVMAAGLPELEEDQAGGYDTTLCGWLRRSREDGGRGLRAGILYRWSALHMGAWASTVWGGPMALWPDPSPVAE